MKKTNPLPVLAVVIALIVLCFTLYKHTTSPDGPTSTFTPPESGNSAPVAPWGSGVEIITPIA